MNLSEFIRIGYSRSRKVRELLDGAGVNPENIVSEADLDNIPVTSKETLVSGQAVDLPFGGWLGVDLDQLARIYASPGPIYDPEGTDSDFWRWGPALTAAGFTAGDRVINTFSYHLTPAGFMFDSGLRALGCTVIPAGTGNKQLQLTMMGQLDVSGYVGLPSYLMALITEAEADGIEFRRNFSVTKAMVTAEPLSVSLRQELEQRGIEVFQSYGTADLGCVAYECRQHQGMHINQGVILEIVEPNSGKKVPDGQVGEVVITLLNPVYPLLRFGTGDLGVVTKKACPCGNSQPRIKEILGRVGDAVKVRGLFIHPGQLKKLMAQIPDVTYYQAVISQQEFMDDFLLRLETRGSVSKSSLAAFISSRVKEQLRISAKVDVVPDNSLDRQQPQFLDNREWGNETG